MYKLDDQGVPKAIERLAQHISSLTERNNQAITSTVTFSNAQNPVQKRKTSEGAASSEYNNIDIASYDDTETKQTIATEGLDVSSEDKSVDMPSNEVHCDMFGDEIAMEEETSVQYNRKEDADSCDNEPVELVSNSSLNRTPNKDVSMQVSRHGRAVENRVIWMIVAHNLSPIGAKCKYIKF